MSGCVPIPTVTVFLLQALVAEQESKDSGGAAVAEQVLSIMEIILDESNAEPLSEDKVSRAQPARCKPGAPALSHCQQWAHLCVVVSTKNG